MRMTKLKKRGSKRVKVRCPYSLGDHGDLHRTQKDKNKPGKKKSTKAGNNRASTQSASHFSRHRQTQAATFLHVTPGLTFKTLHAANREQVSDLQVSQNKRQTFPYTLKDCSFILGLECVFTAQYDLNL